MPGEHFIKTQGQLSLDLVR